MEQPISELSDKELKFGKFYIENKFLIKRIGLGVLITLNVLIYAYVFFGVYQTLNFLYIGFDRMITAMMTIRPDLSRLDSTNLSSVQVLATGVIPGQNDRYDFYARVRNPNSEWAVNSLTYKFVFGQDETEEYNDFIMPGQEKYLMVLGYESDTRIANAEIEISNVKYLSVDNFEELEQTDLNFEIIDPVFVTADQTGVSDENSVSEIEFTFANKTFKDFWEVGLQVILMRANRVAGLYYLEVNDVEAMQQRPISIKWFEPTGQITNIEVIPSVNIFDKSVYKEIEPVNVEIR